jgi:hypothetical protein
MLGSHLKQKKNLRKQSNRRRRRSIEVILLISYDTITRKKYISKRIKIKQKNDLLKRGTTQWKESKEKKRFSI